MANVSLSPSQVAVLRSLSDDESSVRSAAFSAIVSQVKRQYGIPDEHKVRTTNDDHNSANYPTLLRKKTGEAYPIDPSTGQWVGAQGPTAAPVAPPERKAWFVVDELGESGDVVRYIANNLYFSDGQETLSDGAQPFSLDGYSFAAVDGQLYIQLGESEF
jgi:hypothetical protein